MQTRILSVMIALAASGAMWAGDDFSSPRAKANEGRTIQGKSSDVLVRGGVVGGGRAKQLRHELRTAPVSNPDTLNRRAVARSPRHLEQQTPVPKEVQVAPTK